MGAFKFIVSFGSPVKRTVTSGLLRLTSITTREEVLRTEVWAGSLAEARQAAEKRAQTDHLYVLDVWSA